VNYLPLMPIAEGRRDTFPQSTASLYASHWPVPPKRATSAPPAFEHAANGNSLPENPAALAPIVELSMTGAEFMALHDKLPEETFRLVRGHDQHATYCGVMLKSDVAVPCVGCFGLQLLLRCQVFARMLPDMKKMLIEVRTVQTYFVLIVAILRLAHVHIHLGDASVLY